MNEQIGPDHSMDQPLNTTFEQNIASLSEDERARGERMVEIYHRYIATGGNSEVYSLISKSINALLKEKGEGVRECKLFHLIVGSSLDAEQWREFPLDTPDHDIEKFMAGPLSELLAEVESRGK